MVDPRPAIPTVQFVDTYCELYEDLFPEVRTYEYFKFIHVGLISNIKRKSLPAIAETVGLDNSQGLHHFLTRSPWQAGELEKRRLELILKVLDGRAIDVMIDETGDRKKGETTDYVKRQYIGNLGKIENGIVSVNGYGHCEGMTFPLQFKIFKPKDRLKPGDEYKSKPVLGAEIVRELQEMGFQIRRVLADSLYGESASNFVSVLEGLNIEYAVLIRSNHGVWLSKEQKVRVKKWREFTHHRWDGKPEKRWVREIIFGTRGSRQYWEITRKKNGDSATSSWLFMTQIPNLKYQDVGSIYKIRAGIEYGFKQSKSELGWADFQFTHYSQIEKWWQLVMSAYLMVSLHNETFNPDVRTEPDKFSEHPDWNRGKGWKNHLNNWRLILLPWVTFNRIRRWLKVFPIPQLSRGFPKLIALMNEFDSWRYFVYFWDDLWFSSA